MASLFYLQDHRTAFKTKIHQESILQSPICKNDPNSFYRISFPWIHTESNGQKLHFLLSPSGAGTDPGQTYWNGILFRAMKPSFCVPDTKVAKPNSTPSHLIPPTTDALLCEDARVDNLGHDDNGDDFVCNWWTINYKPLYYDQIFMISMEGIC